MKPIRVATVADVPAHLELAQIDYEVAFWSAYFGTSYSYYFVVYNEDSEVAEAWGCYGLWLDQPAYLLVGE